MTAGADLRAGISVDQIAAREFGKYTQLASLEVGLESAEVVGACESAYGCAYYNTIAWRNDTTPLPMENRPRASRRLRCASGSFSGAYMFVSRSRAMERCWRPCRHRLFFVPLLSPLQGWGQPVGECNRGRQSCCQSRGSAASR